VPPTDVLLLPAPKFQGDNFHANKAIVDAIKTLAQRKNYKLTQVALAWVAAQGMIAIPGTTKPARLEENWSSRDVELTSDELDEMRKIIDTAKVVGNRYGAHAQAAVGH
jgi:aryl-alcohol dehydrogenase-like predicted oxidoreductase